MSKMGKGDSPLSWERTSGLMMIAVRMMHDKSRGMLVSKSAIFACLRKIALSLEVKQLGSQSRE